MGPLGPDGAGGGRREGIGRGFLNIIYMWTISSFLLFFAALGSLFKRDRTIRKSPDGNRRRTIGFFHPYCNAGGGGERVLFGAVRALQQAYPQDLIVIYTGDYTATPTEILTKAKKNFNISINSSTVEFVFLKRRDWVESDPYPIFTLLGQSIGSLYLGLEAFSQFVPDIFLDTMGYAFTLPLFRYLGGSRVGAYVHYPTISTDMLQRVADRSSLYNNQEMVANSATLSSAKLLYYRMFAWIYCKAGRCSEVTMVNSSWTENHILNLWEMPGSTYKVYPSCDVEDFKKLERKGDDEDLKDKKTINIISVSQFRPEKNHALQVTSLKALKEKLDSALWQKIRLVMLGSVRNEGDQKRVEGLKQLAIELGVEKNVVFQINFSFDTMKQELANGVIGIHTMHQEHFGISIVESMAAGLLMVANKSGGPLLDIVVTSPESKRNGFLAADEEEYANVIKSILEMPKKEQAAVRKRGRTSVDRFSDEEFEKKFLEALETIL